jgi:aryl carrier-like protein
MSRTGPASFAHERLYFVDKLHPGHAGYVVAFALRLRGDLDAERLRLALRDLVARHEALRTTFEVRDGALCQRIDPGAEPAIEVVSRAWEDEQAGDAFLRDLVGRGARTPFSLTAGPLLRATIVSWSPVEHALVVLVHHIACDGWSVGILVRELAALYNAEPVPAPPSYLDYAVAQRREWAGADDGLAYWREALAGAPRLALPTDRPRPEVLSDRGAVLRRPLGAELVAALTEWSGARQVTLFATTLAAYVEVLSRYAGQDDIVVGVPVANRLEEEQEALVGCLVNTLPLRIDASGEPPFTRLVERVRETTLSALAYQHVPFEQIVAAVSTERQLSHAPLFQTSFGLQNFPFGWPELAGLAAAEVGVEIGAAKFDLGVSVDVSADEPFVRAEYSTDLFDAGTVAALLDHYVDILHAVAQAPAGAEPATDRVRRAPVAPAVAGQPAAVTPAPAAALPAGAGAVQERIRLIWVEILNRPDVGASDNFFDLGGNSVRMLALQQAMNRAGFAMPLVDLFRCGSVAACARHLTATPAPAEPDEARSARRDEAVRGLAERRRAHAGGSRD